MVYRFAVLGLDPASSPQEAAAAYRRLAKEWHPDRAGVDAARRMAEINAAYDLLRAGDWQRRREGAHARTRRHQGRAHAPARRGPAGAWLSPATRRALGGELLRAGARRGGRPRDARRDVGQPAQAAGP